MAAEVPFAPALAFRLQRLSRSVYAFREEAAFAYRVALVVGFAALTGLAAQVSFTLPFTPVPVTAQVFAVLLSGAVLGRWLGPASQTLYVGLGALGLPWFAPNAGAAAFTNGGWAIVVGVSGGYLIGFVLAALATGWILDRGLRHRTFSSNLAVLLLGVGIIYLAGAVQLALVLGTDLRTTFDYAVLPFLPGDLLKAVLVAVVGLAALPAVGPNDSSGAAAGRAPLRRVDWVAWGVALAAVWAVAAAVLLTGLAGPSLEAYYLLAAVVATGAGTAAVVTRARLARSPAGPTPA